MPRTNLARDYFLYSLAPLCQKNNSIYRKPVTEHYNDTGESLGPESPDCHNPPVPLACGRGAPDNHISRLLYAARYDSLPRSSNFFQNSSLSRVVYTSIRYTKRSYTSKTIYCTRTLHSTLLQYSSILIIKLLMLHLNEQNWKCNIMKIN